MSGLRGDLMAFPTTPIIDATTRANETPLANGWRPISSFTQPNLSSNAIVRTNTSTNGGYWPISFPGGKYTEVYCTIGAMSAGSTFFQLYVGCYLSSSGSCLTTYPTVSFEFDRLTIFASSINSTTFLKSISAGDSIGFSCDGQCVTAYVKKSGVWAVVGSMTGTPTTGSGFLGFGIAGFSATGSITNFGGGSGSYYRPVLNSIVRTGGL